MATMVVMETERLIDLNRKQILQTPPDSPCISSMRKQAAQHPRRDQEQLTS